MSNNRTHWRVEQDPERKTVTISLEYREPPVPPTARFSRSVCFARRTISTRWKSDRRIVRAVREAQIEMRAEAEKAWSRYVLLWELLGHLDMAPLTVLAGDRARG